MKLKPLIHGLATFVPGARRLFAIRTGGTDSAKYCYSVWLRHLVMAKKNGLKKTPRIVAELGPGDSIGIGLAALISGCDKYYAFDVVDHSNIERNLTILDELFTLFKNKTPIPGQDELPKVSPKLEDYRFPSDIFDEGRLKNLLAHSRMEKIRQSVRKTNRETSLIEYKAPWYDSSVLEAESVDMVYSQAVLEHVDDLKNTYKKIYSWLKPNGYMSHTIDFKCHGTADEWNGHWTYSDFMWKLIRGKRTYLLNRAPHSTHIKLINQQGFELLCDLKTFTESNVTLRQLASKFRNISHDDLSTSGTFIQASKRVVNDQ